MIPFWWACCTAWQTRTNSSSRSRTVSWSLVAVLGDRDAADQLHDEVGPARVGGAGVEHLGDVGVVHQRQGLPLGLEAGDDLPRVHARLDDLQGHLAADRAASARPCRRRPCRPRRSAPAACTGRSTVPGLSAGGRRRRPSAGAGRRAVEEARPPRSWASSSASTRPRSAGVAAARPVQVGRRARPATSISRASQKMVSTLGMHRRSSASPAGSRRVLHTAMREPGGRSRSRDPRISQDRRRAAGSPAARARSQARA